jgi:general secretion pathway protein J
MRFRNSNQKNRFKMHPVFAGDGFGKKEADPGFFGCGKASGFTLMEMMLAVLILGIVFTTIYGAWATVSGTSRIVDTEITDFESAGSCLNRILLDIQGVYVTRWPEYAPPDTDDDSDPYRVLGQATDAVTVPFTVLRFAARSHLPLSGQPGNGTARIAYYLDSNTGGPPFVIRRADDLFPYHEREPNASDPVLCRNVNRLSFVFTDQDGETHDDWDSDDRRFGFATPRVIGIRLEIGDDNNTRVFRTATTLPVYRKSRG